MKKRTLGASGIELPELTLGTWLTFSTSNQEAANGLVEAAFSAGMNAFDTADVYGIGDGESALAIALSRYPRDCYFLASKVFFPMSDAPEDRGLSVCLLSPTGSSTFRCHQLIATDTGWFLSNARLSKRKYDAISANSPRLRALLN